MTHRASYMVDMGTMRRRTLAIVYSILIVSSLSTGALAQQFTEGLADNSNGFVNTLYSNIGDNNAVMTNSDAFDNSLIQNNGVISSQYDNSMATRIASVPMQAVQQVGVPAILPAQSVYGYQPQQYGFGYQPRQNGGFYGQHPGFNANYWTGSLNKYPVRLPAYKPVAPVAPVHVMPVHYPVHPVYPAMHGQHIMPKRFRSRGFLGGTGSGVVKGVLGAVLAGVVAGKVARGK